MTIYKMEIVANSMRDLANRASETGNSLTLDDEFSVI